jgi:hypothetical protein
MALGLTQPLTVTSTRKSGYNTYRGWTQMEHQNKRCNINQKDGGTQDERGRDGRTNFILRIKEQETRLIAHKRINTHKHDDDDDDDECPDFLYGSRDKLV